MRIKRSTLAGTWYPGEAGRLRRTVDALLAEAPAAPIDAVLGLIVPHAGYEYSGAVAAAAYRVLRDAPRQRVVLLAPSHRGAFRGVARLDADAFETPLGLVHIDPAALPATDLVRFDPSPFAGEHSLEIQLPFLQRALPEAVVVPFLLGNLQSADYAEVAALLARLADDRTVFVVSSDFTHYGWRFGYEPFPAEGAEQVRERLRALDMGAIAPVLEGDASEFQRYLAETGDTVCGHVPIGAFLSWVSRRYRGVLLAYRTSLDVTGDYEHCVSYAAIAFPAPRAS